MASTPHSTDCAPPVGLVLQGAVPSALTGPADSSAPTAAIPATPASRIERGVGVLGVMACLLRAVNKARAKGISPPRRGW